MNCRIAGLLLLVTAAAGSAGYAGQYCPAYALPPHASYAPLLFVRFSGPAGSNVTFFQGSSPPRSFDAPVSVGLRPGYIYRLRLDGLKEHPGVTLYPSVEVRGTLRLLPTMRAADHPAPVVFTEEDIVQAANGIMVTKVILLENPDKSLDLSPRAEEPAELETPAGVDPIAYAESLGRPLLVVRIGRREPEPHELARLGPGLILFPGDTTLPPVARPTFIDPRMIPKAGEEECLRDGGDRGTRAYREPGAGLQGLDPADSVVEYTDSLGRRHLLPTNEVCLCVPRFLAVRNQLPSSAVDTLRSAIRVEGQQTQGDVFTRQETRRTRQIEDAETLRGRQRLHGNTALTPQIHLTSLQELAAFDMNLGSAAAIGSTKAFTLTDEEKTKLTKQINLAIELSRSASLEGAIGTIGTGAIGQIEGLGAVQGHLETRVAVYLCEQDKPEVPEQPLQVHKWASTQEAKIGDVVTFYIRYSNLGGKPIRDIAVSDSLTGRLEYVKGTARSDRAAIFVTQENEAGSVILRWEIRDPLPPGERGVVSFQARVK